MKTLPERKPNRLEGYDYSREGMYFLTVCTKGKSSILSHVVGRGILDAPGTELTEYGTVVDAAIHYLHAHLDDVFVESYVIMPNHIHLLVRLTGGASGRPRPTANHRQNSTVPKFISSLKRYTNRACGRELWQTSYYDHIIRNEQDFLTKLNYIETNPARWADDPYYPKH